MEIEGIITRVLPERTGTSHAGKPWRMASYVLETIEQYPKHIMFDVSDGDSGRIARLNIQEGKRMRIFFEIDAREWEGKWFNSIRAWDAREVGGNNAAVVQQIVQPQAAQPQPQQAPQTAAPAAPSQPQEIQDLPF